MVAALIEPLHETTRGMEVAVVAYTKGQLSAEELWAELDWAASCYQKAAEATTQAEQAMRATPGLSERERQVLGAKFAQDAARYTAWAEGIKLRYVELTRD
jgi:FixJ family two-component response regulator